MICGGHAIGTDAGVEVSNFFDGTMIVRGEGSRKYIGPVRGVVVCPPTLNPIFIFDLAVRAHFL